MNTQSMGFQVGDVIELLDKLDRAVSDLTTKVDNISRKQDALERSVLDINSMSSSCKLSVQNINNDIGIIKDKQELLRTGIDATNDLLRANMMKSNYDSSSVCEPPVVMSDKTPPTITINIEEQPYIKEVINVPYVPVNSEALFRDKLRDALAKVRHNIDSKIDGYSSCDINKPKSYMHLLNGLLNIPSDAVKYGVNTTVKDNILEDTLYKKYITFFKSDKSLLDRIVTI